MGNASKLAKRVLNLPLKPMGLEIVRRGTNHRTPPQATVTKYKSALSFDRLKDVAKLGFAPRTIYDCGAYIGEWAAKIAPIFPGAQIIVVEPNPKLQAKIKESIAGIQPPPVLLEAAISDTDGSAELNVWDNDQTPSTGSSLLGHIQGEAGNKVTVQTLTIDTIAEKTGRAADFLKLDLQGFELPALRGASKTLQTAEFCEIEFGVLEAYVGRSTPRELMDIMYDNHYTLYDIVDLIYRPYDGALTGGDFFFVKNDSPLRKYKAYR